MPGGITGLSGLVGGGNPKRPGEPPLSPAFRKFFASGPEEKENVWPPKKATPVIPVGKKNTLALTSECLLSLLVAQLRNQDPFNPTEGTEFINQLSMLAGVQQSTEMNDKLEKMLRYFTTAETVSAAAIVGKTIESPGQWFEFGGSEAFELSFETPEKVTEAMVSVFDEEGNLIRSCPAVAHPVVEEGRIIGLEAEAPTAGRHKIIFNWLDEHTPYSPGRFDGKTMEGDTVPAGLYRFIVTGKVKQGAKEVPQEFKTQVRAKVTSITSDHGRMLALLGSGVPVPFHSIESLTDTLPRRSLPRPQQTRQIDTEHATPPVEETPPAEETPPVAEGEELPLADALIDLFG